MINLTANNTLLKNKNFFLYSFGSITSLFGDNLYSTTISIWIAVQTNSSLSLLSSILLLRLPKTIVSLLAGPIVDHYNKRKIMINIDLIQGIVCCASSLIISLNNITINNKIIYIYFINFLFSIFSAFFQPSSKAIIPHIIEKSNIKKANVFFSGLQNIVLLCSFMLSGIIVSIFGYYFSILINGLTFFISAFCEFKINYIENITKIEGMVIKDKLSQIQTDMKEAIAFYKKNLKVLILSLSPGIIYLFIFPIINIIFPFVVLKCIIPNNYNMFPTSDKETTGLAFFRSMYGLFGTIGGIVASFLYNKIYIKTDERSIAIKSIFYTGITLFLTSLAFTPVSYKSISGWIIFVVISISSFVIANTSVNNEISVNSWLQINIPKEMQGRFFSFLVIAKEGLICFGVVLFGTISFYFSNDYTLYIYYAICGLTLITLGTILYKKILKNI